MNPPASPKSSGSSPPPPAPLPASATPLHDRLFLWAFSPLNSGRLSAFPRFCLRILLIMYREYFRTHLAIRASALTFTITLALVPILALSTSVLKGLGNDEQLKQAIIRFIEQWEPPALPEMNQRSGDDGPGAADQFTPEPGPAGERSSGPAHATHLHRAVNLIFAYVNRTNFAALGLFGVIGLIVVFLLVLSSIEDAMNAIWHTHKGRSFFRRIMDYLALLLLLPLSLNVALAAEAILANQQIMERLGALVPTAWIAAFFIKLIPFLFIVVTLMTMYLFFPNIKVRTRAALAGALFAAVFWFIFQKIYVALQIGVANYNAIYGSFASIPLFLVWLQIGWTCILLGALLAFAIQHHQHYRTAENDLGPQKSLALAFDILQLVYADFEQRQPTSLALLDQRLPAVQHADIAAVVELLVAARLLRVNDSTTENALIPVTSADSLLAGEVVQAIWGGEPLASGGGELAARGIDAASSVLNVRFNQIPTLLSSHGPTLAADHSHHPGQQ